MSSVVLLHRSRAAYPASPPFSPGEDYPESLCEGRLSEEGDAYAMVRGALAGLGLDKARFGTPAWNPLGALLSPGQTVVIKPNLVMHLNEGSGGLDCLLTHPACIRAICDYCLLALGKTGRVIIGDAPMQGCRWEDLLAATHLPEIVDFYRARGYNNVVLRDFREYAATTNRSSVLTGRFYTGSEGVEVRLDGCSAHAGTHGRQYQVSDYRMEDTAAYHHDGEHRYVVAREVLEADLLIDFCKPKTHRLAGFTGAMKNLVGITFNKSCLPHRSRGSVEEGGDAYLHKNRLKRWADACLQAKIASEESRHIARATLYRYLYGACLLAGRATGKDPYFIGSWYGNDTIWRTVVDLNLIALYADKEGVLCDTPQRRLLCLADMIIAGEGEGPVKPSPKPLGILLASPDPVALDLTLSRLMGFSDDFIPLVRAIRAGETPFPSEDPLLLWEEDGSPLRQTPLSRAAFPRAWAFRPHPAWATPEK